VTDKTSAEMLEEHIAGRLIADGGDRSPKDVIAQIFARNAVQESFIVPSLTASVPAATAPARRRVVSVSGMNL
jgi:hypothetical protein